MAFSLGEYQEIFLEEADEQLQELNQNLLELERDPENLEIINNIFRAAHSLKSSAAFVGLNELSDLAHKMENLLQGIRDKTLSVTPDIVDVIFSCFDMINSVIETVARGEEPTQDLSGLIGKIESLSEEKTQESQAAGSSDALSSDNGNKNIPSTKLESSDAKEIRKALAQGQSCTEVTVFLEEAVQMKWVKAQLIINNLNRIGSVVKTIPSSEHLSSDDMDSVFKIILLSEADLDEIRKACNVDLVVRVDMKNITMTSRDDRTVIKFGEARSFMTSGSELEDSSSPAVDSADDTDDDEILQEDEADQDFDPVESGSEEDESSPVTSGTAGKKTNDVARKAPVINTVKVSVDKLDQLLNNVAELVIANSGFYKLYDELRKNNENKAISGEFKNRMEQMSRIAKDLQTGIMKTRMVQIGQIFTRFNRLVRDLTKEFGKNVNLVIKGEETELDKKVIDAIGEPLLHLIRNAIDHGIENSEIRKQLGKTAAAQVVLNAYQGGNQIFVEVSDDGRGLDVEVIKRKALEKGLVTHDSLANMDNNDIFNFIFMPGFSTADKVTDVSGRGVGMNVVKEIVSELNGSVSIETEPGMGTRFVMAFPLTLAIIPAIMVMVKKEMYAIPLSDVIETVKISSSDITTIEGHEVLNFRGEILSLLRLSNFIKRKSGLTEEEKIPVVVVGFGNRKIGLIVDSLEGKQEIVIKSLEQNYKTVDGLAGASILGDGSICLILDVASMINKVISEQDKMDSFVEDFFDEEEDEFELQQQVKAEKASLQPAAKDNELFLKTEKPDSFKTDNEEAEIKQERNYKADSTYVSFMEDSKKAEDEKNMEPAVSSYSPPAERQTESPDKPEEKPGPSEFTETTQEKKYGFESQVSVTEDKHEAGSSETDEDDYISESAPKSQSEKSVSSEDEEDDEIIKKKVSDTLSDFKRELKSNINDTVKSGEPSDHMSQSLSIKNEDISEFRVIANIGAANSADSLSRILNKRIDLTIPEVAVKPIESIPELIGNVEKPFFGVHLPILGDGNGTILFTICEDVGFKLVEILFNSSSTREDGKLTEDGVSALEEITNIIGSSIINVFAEKTGLTIKPGLPKLAHDFMQSIIDSILVAYNVDNDYAIVMDTAFFFEDDQVLGNLMILPEARFFKTMVEKLRLND